MTVENHAIQPQVLRMGQVPIRSGLADRSGPEPANIPRSLALQEGEMFYRPEPPPSWPRVLPGL